MRGKINENRQDTLWCVQIVNGSYVTVTAIYVFGGETINLTTKEEKNEKNYYHCISFIIGNRIGDGR